MKITTESFAVYVYEDEVVHIFPRTAPRYTFRAEIFFAIEPKDLEGFTNIEDILNSVERKDPAVGRRLVVAGQSDWRISTKIILIEEGGSL
jgi:hypothetical protein